MPIRTKRWDEPADPADGARILITRFRPRGLPKFEETWDEWQKELAPSPELVKAYRDQRSSSITWQVYRASYLREMQAQREAIEALARRSAAGETITLLCSSSCLRAERCHRSLLKELIDETAGRLAESPRAGA